jgi:hypothetical protein
MHPFPREIDRSSSSTSGMTMSHRLNITQMARPRSRRSSPAVAVEPKVMRKITRGLGQCLTVREIVSRGKRDMLRRLSHQRGKTEAKQAGSLPAREG